MADSFSVSSTTVLVERELPVSRTNSAAACAAATAASAAAAEAIATERAWLLCFSCVSLGALSNICEGGGDCGAGGAVSEANLLILSLPNIHFLLFSF